MPVVLMESHMVLMVISFIFVITSFRITSIDSTMFHCLIGATTGHVPTKTQSRHKSDPVETNE